MLASSIAMSNVVVAHNSIVEQLLPNGKLYTSERSLRSTLPWKIMLLELHLALILLANSGTKMTQQSELEVPELLDLPQESCYSFLLLLFFFLFFFLNSPSGSFSGKRTYSIGRRFTRSIWGAELTKKKWGTICDVLPCIICG